MERSDSTRSNASSSSQKTNASAPFAYQTRLLERTSSRSGSLSRSGSISTVSPLSTGTNTPSLPTRRWTPTHRVGGSLDTVRGKWEERVRAEAGLDTKSPHDTNGSSPSTPDVKRTPSFQSSPYAGSLRNTSSDHLHSETTGPGADVSRTPTYLKRRTMPAPIIASPLSPNTTGITVEYPDSPSSFATPTPNRIHLPTSTSLHSSSISSVKELGAYAIPSTSSTDLSTISRTRRSNTLDSAAYSLGERAERSSSPARSVHQFPPQSTSGGDADLPSPLKRRPASVYTGRFKPTSPDKADAAEAPRPSWRTRNTSLPGASAQPSTSTAASTSTTPSTSTTASASASPSLARTPSSVMFPSAYRASNSTPSRKAGTYGDHMIVGRKLGRHLPRIASGDADDDWVDDSQAKREEESKKDRRALRESRLLGREWGEAQMDHPKAEELVVPGVTTADDVAGIPGRLRLSRDRAPSTPTSPLPSARLARGLWADTQRHLLQAYEYLCHVGEAQQWIEGCLGEELGFGVVEMEEGMRNGVVLAKLVRVFQGEAVVRRIYEAPKLDFRHSDNINYFFNFVRQVGLPESFIFELTDLYEKKNLPKVIYCIHALSHLLARRGLAERIGNLLGRLQFSDDQLQKTQKGLKDAGVPMPNFGNVGKELAKEINEEPEVEVETEDERRDRLLLENEPSIIAAQATGRAYLARKAHATRLTRLHLAERHIPKLQAQCRGALLRKSINQRRKQQTDLVPWAVKLQTAARGVLFRRIWAAYLRRIRRFMPTFVRIQAQARGCLARRKFNKLKTALRSSKVSITKMQSLARARIVQRKRRELLRVFTSRVTMGPIVSLQAAARGALVRRAIAKQLNLLDRLEAYTIQLQAQARGVLIRRRIGTQLAKLEDVTDVVIRIQAAVRTFLARKRLLILIRGLRKATPVLVQLQARARANLARQQHTAMAKALSRVEVAKSVGNFQALARAALTRNRHREQSKRLEFSAPDVVGFQSTARGALARRDYYAWRDHLHRNQHIATLLQALLRGVMQRRQFRAKMHYYRTNLDKVVKIQSLFRAKETRDQYRQLTLGTNVTVGTIKNFVHLLDDSESDFQEEVDLERLRKQVVERIRENQALENDVNDLDVKIALVVQNVKSFEELIKARRRFGADSAAVHAARASVLAAHGDPFAGPNTLDHAAKRKLELYQQLFYLLQARGEYLSKLFQQLSSDSASEKNRRLLERVVLTLFGYGQDRREDYLLLKLFQYSIIEEVSAAKSVQDLAHGHPMYINIAVHYIHPKQTTHLREALQSVIREVVDAEDLDLEADPTVIHRTRVSLDEMRAGASTPKAKDISFRDALNDPVTRPEYIRHLQVLQWWTEAFVVAITQSTRKMPYGIRFIARETLAALREKFPDAPLESYAACIGRMVFFRYINPAIITPETLDIVTNTVDISSRKNLAQISKVLAQIVSGVEFGDENPSYIPINDYVKKTTKRFSAWLMEVADVPDAETQYHAHKFLDATVQPKPIYISPNEVYAMHGLLAQHLNYVAPSRDDGLRIIIHDLDGVPHFGNEELKDARDKAITLELTNRFADVRDPRAEEKALWIQAKRAVLAVLRVQPGKDLVESLMRPVTQDDELVWEEILESEMEADQRLRHPQRMPSTTGQESAYRLEDIRSLEFGQVKAHAIFFLIELEKQGKITRDDGYQDILNSIAMDVRSKHHMRLQRQQEKENMSEALQHLNERKKYYEDQINNYHNYVETAMATMQRGKKKRPLVLPFTKQYFHLRNLQRSGKSPQFGSYKYSAQELYDKGILLSIDQFSPRQFDKIDLVLSSNEVGVFTVEVFNNSMGITNRIANADVRMEDLLQAQFQDRASLSLFNGLAKFNLKLFLFQINKKFFV